MRSRIKNILFFIGLASVVVMLVTFDVSWDVMWANLTHAGYWLLAIVGLWCVLYTLNTLTWWLILRETGPVGITFFQLLKVTVSAFALNFSTPVGLLGGEPYKIMELSPVVGTQRATSSVLLFAMMHIFAHFCYWVTAIVLWLLLKPMTVAMAILLTAAALFCAGGIYLFLRGYRYGLVVRGVRWLGHIPGLRGWARRFGDSHEDSLRNIDRQIAALHSQSRRSFYVSLLLEYVGRVMQSLEIMFMLLLVGAECSWMSFVDSLLILAFTSLFANLLGFMPMQLGGREGGFAMSTAQLGLTGGTGLFISIICRVRELFFTIIGLALMKVPVRRCAGLALLFIATSVMAEERDSTRRDWLAETQLTLEASGTASVGDYAPLWLTANRYGLSSTAPYSIYARARIERDIAADSLRKWRLGYGLDLAVAAGHERVGIVQQAYVEGAWKCLRLTLGAKQLPLETQNAELSSGALSAGINARPVPQARLDIDWFGFPGTKGWWKWKLAGAYGWLTDGRWQEQWAADGQRYARHTLYHEKAVYWQFGREDVFPLTYEIGLRMMAMFGGTSYNVQTVRANDGVKTTYEHNSGLRAYWDALLCRGSDATDGSNPNVSGNHLGSYVMQLKYHGSHWQARAYWERFFEDHSMLTVQYGLSDMLIGGEVTLPRNPYLTAVVLEYLTTTYQSGAVYHDATASIPDQISGRDDYYNHLHYPGWQHYGQTFGNPLITSPLYNDALGHDHVLRFYNNRVKAWHVGLSGDPSREWHWRVLASFSRNWGTYDTPFEGCKRELYTFAEATYRPRWARGWEGALGIALDHGGLIGNSYGGQLTIRKQLRLK